MPAPFDKPTLAFSLTFESDGAWPTAVALFDGGKKLAAADRTGAIHLWDIAGDPPAPDPKAKKEGDAGTLGGDRPPYRTLVGHTNAVTRLVALPDGKTLVSAGLDRTVRLWDTQAASVGHVDVIVDAERRKREAKKSGKKEGDAKPAPGIKLETIKPLATFEEHAEWINALNISRDGKRIISGDDAARVIVWDVATKKSIAKWTGRPGGWITSAALDAAGKLAFVGEYCSSRGDFDRPPPEARLFDVEEAGKHPTAATGAPIAPGVTASAPVKLDILALQTPQVKKRDNSYEYFSAWGKFVARGFVAADFSPDGSLVALAQGGETDTGKIHLIETATGKLTKSVSGHQYGATDVFFDKDGEHVLSAGRDTVVRIVAVKDGKEVAALGKPRGGQFKDWITAIALSPDQKTLATADMAGVVHVWRFG